MTQEVTNMQSTQSRTSRRVPQSETEAVDHAVDTTEPRSHSEATSLAGDASTAQAEALTGSLHGSNGSIGSNRSNGSAAHASTGPITKIARIFGASCLVTSLFAATLVSETVGASTDTVTAHSLVGTTDPSFIAPPPTTRYVATASSPRGTGAWLLEANGTVRAVGTARNLRGAPTDPNRNPAVDIAPSGRGFWILTANGRVTPRLGAPTLAPLPTLRDSSLRYVALTALPDGQGFYVLRSDGAVLARGRAVHRGDLVDGTKLRRELADDAPVDVAVARNASGYYVVTERGVVHKFGRIFFDGEPAGFIGPDVVGLDTDPDGRGYWLALRTGAVLAYKAGPQRTAFGREHGVAAIEIAARARNGYWTLQREAVDHLHPFLVCTRSHESSHTPPNYDDGYAAVNPSGKYRGAYQFARTTWDSTAAHAGRPDLIGVDPAAASVIDQDTLALHLYEWQGADPWLGRCAGL